MNTLKLHDKIYELQSRLNKRYDRIFILPTRFGLYFILIIFILFLMSLSYGHSLAITGTFLFVSIVMVSAHFTNFNLSGLKRSGEREVRTLFRDDEFTLLIDNTWRKPRVDIDIEVLLEAISNPGDSLTNIELRAKNSFEAHSQIKVKFDGLLKRGVYRVSKLKVSSDFPFGLFRSWMYLEPLEKEVKIYIYPRPIKPEREFKAFSRQRDLQKKEQHMEEDASSSSECLTTEMGTNQFHEHSPYREGDETRRIDWKIYSRTHELYLKHYHDSSFEEYIIDRSAFSSFALEEQLSFLCHRVLELSRQGVRFALVLDGEQAIWGEGKKFEEICLKRLSEY